MGALDKLRSVKNLGAIIKMINQLQNCPQCSPRMFALIKQHKQGKPLTMTVIQEELQPLMCDKCVEIVKQTGLTCAKTAGVGVKE